MLYDLITFRLSDFSSELSILLGSPKAMAISPSQSLDKEVLYLGLGVLRGGLNLHRFDHLQVADVSRTRILLPRSRLCLGILTCAEGMWQKDGGTSTATTKWLSERGGRRERERSGVKCLHHKLRPRVGRRRRRSEKAIAADEVMER